MLRLILFGRAFFQIIFFLEFINNCDSLYESERLFHIITNETLKSSLSAMSSSCFASSSSNSDCLKAEYLTEVIDSFENSKIIRSKEEISTNLDINGPKVATDAYSKLFQDLILNKKLYYYLI